MRSERGYTVPEVVLFVLVLGILGMLAMPSFRETGDRLAANRAARLTATELRYAQQAAVTEHTSWGVQVTTTGLTLLRGGATIRQTAFSDGVTASANFAGASTVTFSWDGSPSAGGTVTLTTRRGRTLTVTVTGITGRVKVGP